MRTTLQFHYIFIENTVLYNIPTSPHRLCQPVHQSNSVPPPLTIYLSLENKQTKKNKQTNKQSKNVHRDTQRHTHKTQLVVIKKRPASLGRNLLGSLSLGSVDRSPVFQRWLRLHLILAKTWSYVRIFQVVLVLRDGRVIEISWGLAPWEGEETPWWGCRLRSSWRSRVKGTIQRSWGSARGRVLKRGYWQKCSPAAVGDSRIFTDTSGAGLSLILTVCTMASPWSQEDCEWITDIGH